jgi:hypothetical protein
MGLVASLGAMVALTSSGVPFNPEYFYSSPAEFAAAVGEKSRVPLRDSGKKPYFPPEL